MKKIYNILLFLIFELIIFPISGVHNSLAQTAMMNAPNRHITSLNGKWQVIVDPLESGNWKQIWKDRKPEKKSDFMEYSFEGSPMLNVPGDFNSQMAELTYYEGTVWYKKAGTHASAIPAGVEPQRPAFRPRRQKESLVCDEKIL